jgi:hypothetical protein
MRRRRWADTAAAHVDAAGRRLSTLQWHGPSLHWNDRAVGGVDWPARVSGGVPLRGRVRVDWRGGLVAARRGGAAGLTGQGDAACRSTTWPVGVGLDVFRRWQGKAAAPRAHVRRCDGGTLPSSRAVFGLRWRWCDLVGGRVKFVQLLDHVGGSLPNSSQWRLCLRRGPWQELGAGQLRQVGISFEP